MNKLIKNLTDLILKKELTGKRAMQIVEYEILEACMEVSKFNQSKAAINMGMSRGNLRSKLGYYFKDKYLDSSTVTYGKIKYKKGE